jgi:hypothetical protein
MLRGLRYPASHRGFVAGAFSKYPLITEGPRATMRPTWRSGTTAPSSSVIRMSCPGKAVPQPTIRTAAEPFRTGTACIAAEHGIDPIDRHAVAGERDAQRVLGP